MSMAPRVACVLLTLAPAVAAQAAEKEEAPAFEIYGFTQADYVQDFKRVNPAWEDTLRPSRIPTEKGLFGQNGQAVISVRQSRFGAKGRFDGGENPILTTFEFDMFGVGVDEGQTTIRLRHAYGEWGAILAGQTNSLFMDGDLFPNTLDYWGPCGMVFLRTPQIRWQPVRGDTYFAVAIEHATGDIDPGRLREVDPDLGDQVRPTELAPDVTAQFRLNGDWGHLQVSGIGRYLGWESIGTEDNEPNDHLFGWGVDVGTNFKFGERDRLILGVVYGHGIASYMNDGGTDVGAAGEVGDLTGEAVPLFGVVGYYDHYWSKEWSSAIGYSRTQVENTDAQADDAFHIGQYASANLLFSPNDHFLTGAEFLWGRRDDNGGSAGDDYRVQISVKYSFSSNVLFEKK
jgi:hypothetical protein